MALSSCFPPAFNLIDHARFSCKNIRFRCVPKSNKSEMFGQQVMGKEWRPNILCRKSSVVYASWVPCSEIASGAFTLGTVAVLPFYTSMVVAPRSDFTKKLVTSSLPYVVLGALYAYLLYLSWTPETMRFMFASKYWLPELPGIAKMFSSEITLASAWIHLLAVDLFAASKQASLRRRAAARYRDEAFGLSVSSVLSRWNSCSFHHKSSNQKHKRIRKRQSLTISSDFIKD